MIRWVDAFPLPYPFKVTRIGLGQLYIRINWYIDGVLLVPRKETLGSAMESHWFPDLEPLVSGFRTNGFALENF